MKILITGGAGFIGSHLAEYLLSKGQSVVVLDDFSGSSEGNLKQFSKSKQLTIVKGSILDQKIVKKLMKDVTHCYHLAACLGVEKISNDPINSLEINLKGSQIVLNEAIDKGLRTLVASSSEIYGKNPNIPLAEDSDRVLGSPEVARWSYSEAKAMD